MNTIASIYQETIIDGFKVVAGNCMECAKSAIAIARVTGSNGATEIRHEWRGSIEKMAKLPHNEINTELGDRFAIVKRLK